MTSSPIATSFPTEPEENAWQRTWCIMLSYLLSPHASFSISGILLSVYALYVETRKHKDPKYVAMCDLGENMQCSKVLTSEYSKGFGLVQYLVGRESFLNLPNCLVGIVFYSTQLALGYIKTPWAHQILLYSSVVGAVGSVYLAYILFFVLHDICLVCISTYIVNFGLLYLNYKA